MSANFEQQTELIQSLFFPINSICSEESLYYIGRKQMVWYENESRCLNIMPNQNVSFHTYFNVFPLAKWKKYCGLSNLILRVEIKGKGNIIIIGGVYQDQSTIETLTTIPFDFGESKSLEISIPVTSDYKTIALEIISESYVCLYDAVFLTETCRNKTNVVLGLNICTRNRLPYLLRNLSSIDQFYQQKQYVPPVIVITNNGDPIVLPVFSLPFCYLQSGEKSGSAGGFSRGCKTLLEKSSELGITHCIFMDDDIILDPRILVRLSKFLEFMQPDYRNYTIGGSLLYISEPYIQHESGALWNGGYIKSVKHNLDLRNPENIIWNEVEEQTEFMGWWFCCVPLVCIKEKGFPLEELYFHRDDVEFGLRNPQQLSLSGIAVWHEPFYNKNSAVEKYYDARNMAIVNSIHCPQYDWKWYFSWCAKAVRKEIMRYRYEYGELIICGALDFCKGKKWIEDNNNDKFFSDISEKKYKEYLFSDLKKQLIKYSDRRCSKPWPKWKRFLFTYCLCNGMFLPWKKTRIVSYEAPMACELFHSKDVYSVNKSNAFYFYNRLNLSLAFKLIIKLHKLRGVLKKEYDKNSADLNNR